MSAAGTRAYTAGMRLAAVLLILASAPAAAELYRWTDAQGRVHYSEVRPRQGQAQKIVPAPPPSPGAVPGDLRNYVQQLESSNAERDRNRAQGEEERRQRHAGCLQARAEMRLRDEYQGRTFTLDENGQRVMLTPEQEAAARAGAQQRIADHCGESP